MQDVAEGTDYSQYGEQKIILEYFANHADAPRYCVDAGAYEGTIGSNSRALFLQGWAGVAIEPDPRSFARLNALYERRPDIVCLRRALSNHIGLRRMRFCNGPPGTLPEDEWKYAQVNTFSEHFANSYIKDHNYRYSIGFVVTTTLMRVLKRVNTPKDIGFMSIDCETEDLNIVRSLDFQRYWPRLICVECGLGDEQTRSQFSAVLKPNGYKYHAQTVANAFFCLT